MTDLVSISSCLQLATSIVLISRKSALKATTGQAQPTRTIARITCIAMVVMYIIITITFTIWVFRCARCAWLQWIETSAIKGQRVMGTGTLVHSLGSMNLSPMIPEITSNPPNRPIWFVDDPLWFADTSFCISNTQQLLKITSNSALFFQNPCTIQINVLHLQHQNPQAS